MRNSFTSDLNEVPTAAVSDVTEIHDERQLTSPLSTQKRKVIASTFSASVHQQAAASGSQHHRVSQIRCTCQMLGVAGNCNEVESQALLGVAGAAKHECEAIEALLRRKTNDETPFESCYPASSVTTQQTRQASHRITTT